MKYIIIFIFISFSSLFCLSENKKKLNKVNVLAVKSQDTLFLQIENNTDKVIYVPKNYIGTYNIENDTVWLLALDKPSFNTIHYYRYDKLFGFKFYTTQKLENFKPDSIFEFKQQTYLFNQFIMSPFAEIRPKTKYNCKAIFNIPCSSNLVKIAVFKNDFTHDYYSSKNNYSLNDYLKFDSLNVFYINTPLVEAIR